MEWYDHFTFENFGSPVLFGAKIGYTVPPHTFLVNEKCSKKRLGPPPELLIVGSTS